MLLILLMLFQNGLQAHSVTTPLFLMRTVSLASSQSCRSVDTDAWCKRALTLNSPGLLRLMVFAKHKPKWPSVPHRNAPWDPNLLNKPLPNKNLTLTGYTFSYRYRIRVHSHWAERTRKSSLNQGVGSLASPVADPRGTPRCPLPYGPKFS